VAAKEGFFGGLPDDVFNVVAVYLQGVAGAGTAASAPALSALVSLAKSEHAAAVSTKEVRLIDAVFKAIDIQKDVEALTVAPSSGLPAALATFQAKLDGLAIFWSGK